MTFISKGLGIVSSQLKIIMVINMFDQNAMNKSIQELTIAILKEGDVKRAETVLATLKQHTYEMVKEHANEEVLNDSGAFKKVEAQTLSKVLNRKFEPYNGKTYLHHTCAHRNLELSELLLDFGADPNIPDQEGNTPLDNVVLMYEKFLKTPFNPSNEVEKKAVDNLKARNHLEQYLDFHPKKTYEDFAPVIGLLIKNGADLEVSNLGQGNALGYMHAITEEVTGKKCELDISPQTFIQKHEGALKNEKPENTLQEKPLGSGTKFQDKIRESRQKGEKGCCITM